ncbi:MAG: SPOR domain-containing protein [Treponemataceae bacterium]
MDSKRTLWILAAVGLFLLAVVGFALIVYAPAKNSKPANINTQATNDIWIASQPELEIKSTEVDTLKPLHGINQNGNSSTQIQNFQNQNSIDQEQNYYGQNQDLQSYQKVKDLTVLSDNTKIITNGNTTIDLTGIISNSSSQPVITNNSQLNTESSSYQTLDKKNQSKDEKVYRTSENSATKPVAKKTTSTKATPTATRTTAIQPKYWIQVSSYSSKKNAEEARNALSSEKIPGEIFTFSDKNGTLFYRVRVGPYTTKSEAEYWQERIKSIEKFTKTQTFITDSSAKAK